MNKKLWPHENKDIISDEYEPDAGQILSNKTDGNIRGD